MMKIKINNELEFVYYDTLQAYIIFNDGLCGYDCIELNKEDMEKIIHFLQELMKKIEIENKKARESMSIDYLREENAKLREE